MKLKTILCLALALYGGLFGCSSDAQHAVKTGQADDFPVLPPPITNANPGRLIGILLVLAALGIFLALIRFLPVRKTPRNFLAPKYSTVISNPPGSYGMLPCNIESGRFVENNRVWVEPSLLRHELNTQMSEFWYDLDQDRVVGELSNAREIMASPDQSKLLCEPYYYSEPTFEERVSALLNKIAPSKWRIRPSPHATLYILNLTNNSLRNIGGFYATNGFVETAWFASPGCHYCYTVPAAAKAGSELFLCDIEAETLSRIPVSGDPVGWWDDRNVFLKDPASNLALFNVVTRKTKILLSAPSISEWLHCHALPSDPSKLMPMASWDGHNYAFYVAGWTNNDRGKSLAQRFGDEYRNGHHKSFLVKIEREGPRLKLLDADFQFEAFGRFDTSIRHYTYPVLPSGHCVVLTSGDPVNPSGGGVVVRNLTDNTTRILVQRETQSPWSGPGQFYGNSILYITNWCLWRIDINGSNNMPLLNTALAKAALYAPLEK